MKRRLQLSIVTTALALASCSQPVSEPALQAGAPTSLDLRTTTIDALTAEQRAALETASRVQITFRNGQVMTYENVRGNMVYDGDMIIGHSPDAVDFISKYNASSITSQATSIFSAGKGNWSNRTVPYFWNPSDFTTSDIAALNAAVDKWNSQAGNAVRWVWSTTAANRVKFVKGPANGGCGLSSVGSIGGIQTLEIAPNCYTNFTLLHEMGHAAGFQHEHQRCDRDNYVVIGSQYVSDSVNYGKGCNWSTYGPYDYDSVMNYWPPYVNALNQPNGTYTGTPSNLGKMNVLSTADIKGLQGIYGAATGGMTYTGSVNQGQSAFEPRNSAGFSYGGGTLKATLSGPSGTDFDLYLLKWNGSQWAQVAASEGAASSEAITYNASSGTYSWKILAYQGSGSYNLIETR